MKFDSVKVDDRILPVEQILRRIREGQIQKATITFIESGEPKQLIYQVTGEVNDGVFVKGLDLAPKPGPKKKH